MAGVCALAGRRARARGATALAVAVVAAATGAALGARALARADRSPSPDAKGEGVVFRAESPYAQLVVLDRGAKRTLLLDGGMHTIVRRSDLSTAHDYAVVGGLALEAFDLPGRALVLGVGGGSLCKDFARLGWRVDAVDVDPLVPRVARDWFGLRPDDARVVEADARRFLARSRERWDLIFYDAFGSGSIPFHLVTREAFGEAKARLTPGGVVAVNVEAVGWRHVLVRSLGATLATRFRHVVALPIAEPPDRLGNLILLASDRPIDVPLVRLGDPLASLHDDFEHWRVLTRNHAWDNRFTLEAASGPILTDDLNPVDLWSEEINRTARRALHRQLGPVGSGG